MLSASAAARSREICRKLSFFATRSSIGRNCSGPTSRFWFQMISILRIASCAPSLSNLTAVSSRDQAAFRIGDALKPVGQRLPVEIFCVVEFDFAWTVAPSAS